MNLRIEPPRSACVASLAVATLLLAGLAHAQAAPDGANAFLKHCAYCHAGQVPGYAHAPRLAQLKQLGPERVRDALVNGRMRPNARFMSREEIEAVIAYITASAASPAN